MHTEDVTFTVGGTGGTDIDTASVASGGAVILVEGYKQNIQVTSSVRAMDASAKLDIAVSFKMPMNAGHSSPLECSGMDGDSNANAGKMTVTLTAPEGSAGNYFMAVSPAAMNSIKSKIGA